MRWLVLFVALAWAPAVGAAQEAGPVVLIVDPGAVRVNVTSLGRAIERSIERPIVRMTDDAARGATSRLTIAHQSPDRWVLRYERGAQVAWVSDRIAPGALRARLSELTRGLIERVEQPRQRRPASPSEGAWVDEDMVMALRNEIIDPFADEPPRPTRPITLIWNEVIDPFRDLPPARSAPAISEVWSEVLDPWAGEIRRHRR